MNPAENPHAGQGMVVLDIGGDIGALVISTPAAMVGAEMEICPAGRRGELPDDGAGWWDGDWHSHHHDDHGPAWPHVAVLNRPAGTGVTACAVFPGLRVGSYEVWRRPDGPSLIAADVVGGQVTSATWPPS